jgi:hypothetical protein
LKKKKKHFLSPFSIPLNSAQLCTTLHADQHSSALALHADQHAEPVQTAQETFLRAGWLAGGEKINY